MAPILKVVHGVAATSAATAVPAAGTATATAAAAALAAATVTAAAAAAAKRRMYSLWKASDIGHRKVSLPKIH